MATFGFDMGGLPSLLRTYARLSKEMSKGRKGGPPEVKITMRGLDDHRMQRYTFIEITEDVEDNVSPNKIILQLDPKTGEVTIMDFGTMRNWSSDAQLVKYLAEMNIVKVPYVPDADDRIMAELKKSNAAKSPASNLFSKVKGIFSRGGKRITRRHRRRR